MEPQYCEAPVWRDPALPGSTVSPSPLDPLREEIRGIFDRLRTRVEAATIQEIIRTGNAHQVDPRLIAALVIAESSGDPLAISQGQALGLMQINAKVWGRSLDFTRNNPFDPVTNIRLGVPILRSSLKRYQWLDTALGSYVGDADLSLESTQAYVNRVIRIFEKSSGTKATRNPRSRSGKTAHSQMASESRRKMV